jgi:hypothetical protein
MFFFVFRQCFEKKIDNFLFLSLLQIIISSLVHIKMFLYYFDVII